MAHGYTYQDTLATSEKITWRIEDIIGGSKSLDFAKPFMPEALARTQALGFLSPAEQRTLNQIRGHAYLSIFGLVEEFILPFLLDQTRPQLRKDDHETRALGLHDFGEGDDDRQKEASSLESDRCNKLTCIGPILEGPSPRIVE